jgi:hypothetical protein
VEQADESRGMDEVELSRSSRCHVAIVPPAQPSHLCFEEWHAKQINTRIEAYTPTHNTL